MRKKPVIFAILSILAYAEPKVVEASFTYTTNADGTGIVITSYSGPNAVVIPPTISDLPVTDIGSSAFGDAGITSVLIPNGVTNISYAAFFSCLNLTNLNLPESLVSIGEDALAETGITSIAFPAGLTSIGTGAFGSSSLSSLTIPTTLTNIGDGAFSDCTGLTNLTFDYGVSDIQSNAFGSEESLSNLVIPSSVTNIGDTAFGNCDNLTNIFFSGNAPTLEQYAFGIFNPPETGKIPIYYVATAYYLPGTTGWAEFTSNTFIPAVPPYSTNSEFVPAVMWNPTIQASGTNFGVQDGQYRFDITGTTNLPIAIEACDDLSQSNWVILKRVTITNGLFHFSEPFQSNSPARFYRIGFP